jgi:hypothetical protein
MSKQLTPPPTRTPLADTSGKAAYPWQAWLGDLVTFVNTITGTAGAKGDKGETGAPGVPGAKGDKGDTGAPGPQGEKGDKGDAGLPGPQGSAGAQGPKGDAGTAGIPGVQGQQGDKGDIGDSGAPGAKGDKGDTGSVASAESPLYLDAQKNLSISQVNGVVDGFLSAADWTAFNNKQPPGNYLTGETDPVFAASPAAGITLADITAWNSAGSTSRLSVYTTAQRLALAATQGTICYDSTLLCICVYNGNSWNTMITTADIAKALAITAFPTQAASTSKIEATPAYATVPAYTLPMPSLSVSATSP